MADGDDLDLGNLTECPVCFERLIPPVETCENGHAICSECRKKMNSCPTCRTNFTMNKNTLLNKMLESLPLACKFRTSGCDLQMPIRKIKEHEKICDFREESCYICNAKIFYPDMKDHCFNYHTEDLDEISLSQPCSFLIKNDKEFPNYWGFGRQYIIDIGTFFLHRRYIDWETKTMNYCVQYTGNHEEASKYYYKIEIDQKLPKEDEQFYIRRGLCIPYTFSNSEWQSHKRAITIDLNQIFLNDEPIDEVQWHASIHRIKE